MESIISDLIKQLNSSVWVLIALLFVAFYLVSKVSNLIGKWSEKSSHQDEKIGNLSNLAKDVIVMQTKVEMIYQNTLKTPLVMSSSPLTLTNAGKEISEKIEANKILQKYISQLCSEVELTSPKNAYDIQMAAIKIVKEKLISFLNEKELTDIKNQAYLRGILVEDVLSVFGILLRNHILNEKGIPIADVDKHDISNK